MNELSARLARPEPGPQHRVDTCPDRSMLATLLRPHPNCIAIRIGRGGRLTGGSWFPLLHLIWLFWVFAAPWMRKDASVLIIAGTYATVPLFLWLYLKAWYGDGARVVHYTVAIAVLGLVTLPTTKTWSYAIYACALFPFCTTPKRALLWLASFMAMFSVVALLDELPLPVTIGAVATCTIIGLLNLFFSINARQDSELRLSQQEVRRLAASAERERIGRDLHDLLGHTLSLIAIKSELADRLFERDPQTAREHVRELHQVARESLTQVRAAVTGIRATGLAVERNSARLLLESSGVSLSGAERLPELSLSVDAALAMCLREAVTNVHRHAGATNVLLSLQQDGAAIELSIADDGRGGVNDGRFGNGLQGMRQRLEAIGGSLSIESPPGRGTRLSLRVPTHPAAAPIAAAVPASLA